MSHLKDRNIVLGITGSIAAYKSLSLIRQLKADGTTVIPILTPSAEEFVTPLTVSALAQAPVLTSPLDSGQISHIETAYAADLLLIAPLSANSLAKMAQGICDNLLLETWLSFKGPVLVAPAMETHMWEHPATQQNVQKLREMGVHFIGPFAGSLASGRSGLGRMASEEAIILMATQILTPQDFAGKKALVTAGPTAEDLDPVRYLTNRSTGKMGLAIAKALALRGAEVTLVHGPIHEPIPDLQNLKAIGIRSARKMHDCVMSLASQQDMIFMTAAVADFTPLNLAAQKLKKNEADLNQISWQKNPDILEDLGKLSPKAFLVGFAAETQNLVENAQEKCLRKNCDIICANDVSDEKTGFGSDQNTIQLIDPKGRITPLGPASKLDIAFKLLDSVAPLIRKK